MKIHGGDMGGFLPFSSRSFFMMDLVSVAMVLVLPILYFSIKQARVKKNYLLHKKIQSLLGFVLLVAVILFEVQVRMIDWDKSAKLSPYYQSYLFPFLYLHLIFAVSTFFLLITTYYNAFKRFPKPPLPGTNSAKHKKLGVYSALGLLGTSVTGWIFYYLAFVASY